MNDIKEILEDKKVSHSLKSREMQEYVDVIKICSRNPSKKSSIRDTSIQRSL